MTLFHENVMGLLLKRYQVQWETVDSKLKSSLTSEFNYLNMNSFKDQKRVVQVEEKVDETPLTTFGGGNILLKSKVSN